MTRKEWLKTKFRLGFVAKKDIESGNLKGELLAVMNTRYKSELASQTDKTVWYLCEKASGAEVVVSPDDLVKVPDGLVEIDLITGRFWKLWGDAK